MRAIWAKNFDRRLSLTNWKYRVLSDVLLLLLFRANTTLAVMQYSCKGRRKLTYIDQHFDSLSKDFITQLSFVFKVCIVLLSVSLKMSCLPQIKKKHVSQRCIKYSPLLPYSTVGNIFVFSYLVLDNQMKQWLELVWSNKFPAIIWDAPIPIINCFDCVITN